MKGGRFVCSLFIEALLLTFLIDASVTRSVRSRRDFLSRLLNKKSDEKPVIVMVDLNSRPRGGVLGHEIVRGNKPLNFYWERNKESEVENEKDEDREDAVYSLINLLNLNSESETSDSTSSSTETAKQFLRSALRSRCQRVNSCVNECPPSKPSCPFNCQHVFDSLNLCEVPSTPDPCKENHKYGKTMPPKWRFL